MHTIEQPDTALNIALNTEQSDHVSPLQQARNLPLPSKSDMLRRAPSVEHFWHQNSQLFEQA